MTSYNLSWYQKVFSDIQNDILVLSKLKEIKVALTGLKSSQLSQLASSLELHILFDCLNTFEKDQVQITCDILKFLLSSLPSSTVFQRYHVNIARAIKHPEKCVKETILRELLRGSTDREMERLISRQPAILEDSFNLLKDEDLSVAQIAIELITSLGLTNYGFKALISPPLVMEIIECLDRSTTSVNSLRVYQVLIEIGVKSEDKLKQLDDNGVLRGMSLLLNSDDILEKAAAIEELSKLAETRHGFIYLSRVYSIKILTEQLINSLDSPFSSLVYPGLLKFFGSASRLNIDFIYQKHPEVLDAIMKAANSEDIVISVTALETIGFIASSYQGKLILNKLCSDSFKSVLSKMQEIITVGVMDWKVRVLYAVGNLIQVDVNGEKRIEVTNVAQKWYSWLGGGGASYLIEQARTPFPEVKLAALHVLSRLVAHKWGQEQVASISGAVDFLLNRSTETTMEGLVAKYNIVVTLADSPSSSEVFTESDLSRILDYKKEGVTHVPDILQVAVEGAE